MAKSTIDPRFVPSAWEGYVTIGTAKTHKGAVQVTRCSEHAKKAVPAHKVAKLLKLVIKAGKPVLGYSIWDSREGKDYRGKVVSAKAFAELVESATDIVVVARRKPFPQPVLRFIFDEKQAKAEAKIRKQRAKAKAKRAKKAK